MAHLSNRNIIIGVCGGIAAYKAAEIVRLFKKAGASVRVVMSRGAQEFITPLTLQALSGEPVHTELLDEAAEAGMGHIELARWADAMLVAPATADVIARLAQGRADDLLTTVALATPAPVFIAPAMNQQMWLNAATAANVATLATRGAVIIGPDAGEQACGDVGPGRLLDPEAIASAVSQTFDTGDLAGRKVVITAGPTREALDPVRYLSNHSSGKMGFALARAAAEAGAETILIAGPVNLPTPPSVRRIDVVSAEEMLAATLDAIEATEHDVSEVGNGDTGSSAVVDIFIAAAAVSDYRPTAVADQKIKKAGAQLSIELTRNPDIVATVSNSSHRPHLVVGFAAETQALDHYAADKLTRKGLDVIIANDVSRSDIGFNSDSNAVSVIDSEGGVELPTATKQALAVTLIAQFAKRLNTATTNSAGGPVH